MLRLGGRQALRGRFLGSWGSPGDESSFLGGTINSSRHFFSCHCRKGSAKRKRQEQLQSINEWRTSVFPNTAKTV